VEAPSIEPYRKIDGRQIVTAAIGTPERYSSVLSGQPCREGDDRPVQ
jgi:hypothetical protein